MKSAWIPALLLGALAGAAIWALSPLLSAHVEPWDAGGFYYAGALLALGLASGLAIQKPLWGLYAGCVLGQLLYMLVFIAGGPLILVGAVFLLLWTLLYLAAAWAGSRLRGRAGKS